MYRTYPDLVSSPPKWGSLRNIHQTSPSLVLKMGQEVEQGKSFEDLLHYIKRCIKTLSEEDPEKVEDKKLIIFGSAPGKPV